MANRLFRIHTEYSPGYQKNAEIIVGLVHDSFNIVRGTGYWKRQREESMTIEIIAGSLVQDEISIRATAKAIQLANDQEAVYLTITELQTADLIR